MATVGNNIMTLPNNANDENTLQRTVTQRYIHNCISCCDRLHKPVSVNHRFLFNI